HPSASTTHTASGSRSSSSSEGGSFDGIDRLVCIKGGGVEYHPFESDATVAESSVWRAWCTNARDDPVPRQGWTQFATTCGWCSNTAFGFPGAGAEAKATTAFETAAPTHLDRALCAHSALRAVTSYGNIPCPCLSA